MSRLTITNPLFVQRREPDYLGFDHRQPISHLRAFQHLVRRSVISYRPQHMLILLSYGDPKATFWRSPSQPQQAHAMPPWCSGEV